MKIRICLLAMIFFLLHGAAAQAQEFGKMRALQQRAAVVTNQKNDFVARVLTSYRIPYERNSQGAVARIKIEQTWFDITAIDIVPVLQESADKLQHVTAHELYFYTAGGILNLVSELIIR